MPTNFTQRTFIGAPMDYDLLAGELDSHFPGFSEGLPLWWGIAVTAARGAWVEEAKLVGMDWLVEVHPPDSLNVLVGRRKTTARTYSRRIKECCALITVFTGLTEINAARDVGRLAVRRLAALVRRELPQLQLGEIEWEGAIGNTPRNSHNMLVVTSGMEAKQPLPASKIHAVGHRLLPIGITKLPSHLGKALEWLALARSARVRIEKFTHLWLAVISLTDHGVDRDKTVAKGRIENYAAVMTNLSAKERGRLAARLKDAYDVRNELWHGAMDSSVTPELLDSLEADAFKLVDFEFVKLGTPL